MSAKRSPRFEWRDAVWESTTLTANQRLVAFALERHMNDRLVARPSVATLARLTGLSVRTVRRSLRELEDAGFIRVVVPAGQHRATTYQGCHGDRSELFEGGHGDRSGSDPGRSMTTLRAVNDEIQGGHGDRRTRSTEPVLHEPFTRAHARARKRVARARATSARLTDAQQRWLNQLEAATADDKTRQRGGG